MAQVFDKWTISPSVSFASGYSANTNPTKFTMPAQNVTAIASYKDDGLATIGGKNYPIVKIGNQVWMAENLDDIYGNCYYNNTTSPPFAKVGKLYEWSQAVASATAINGWHLPSKAEWDALVNFAGGSSTAGRHLKAKSGWNDNGNGLDTYGFAALPGGYSLSSSGSFCDFGSSGSWWGSDESNYSYYGYVSRMYNSNEGVKGENLAKGLLFSVRLVKDA
jgi:uncharacterized protein (TIGR02145 family)